MKRRVRSTDNITVTHVKVISDLSLFFVMSFLYVLFLILTVCYSLPSFFLRVNRLTTPNHSLVIWCRSVIFMSCTVLWNFNDMQLMPLNITDARLVRDSFKAARGVRTLMNVRKIHHCVTTAHVETQTMGTRATVSRATSVLHVESGVTR